MSDKTIEATVMISSKDRADLLLKTLNALRKQTFYDRTEVLVTDDGSQQDFSLEFKKAFPEVHFFRFEKNSGFVLQRCRMFSMARGSYVFSMDDESRFAAEDGIETAVKRLKERQGIAGLSFNLISTKYGEETGDLVIGPAREYFVRYFHAAGCAMNKALLGKQAEYCDSTCAWRGEERYFGTQSFAKGYYILHVNDIVVFHERSKDIANRDNFFLDGCNFVSQIFCFIKFYPIFFALFFSLIAYFDYSMRFFRGGGIVEYKKNIKRVFSELGWRLGEREPMSCGRFWAFLKIWLAETRTRNSTTS